MSLKTCPDCGHEVSSRAERCPHCGRRRTTVAAWIVLILFVIVMLLLAFGR